MTKVNQPEGAARASVGAERGRPSAGLASAGRIALMLLFAAACAGSQKKDNLRDGLSADGAAASAEGAEGAPCETNVECGAGMTCVEGACQPGDTTRAGREMPGVIECSDASALDEKGSAKGWIRFDYNQETIRPEMEDIMEELGECLLSLADTNSDIIIRLEGHADERGTNEYNLALGEQRAKAVRAWLERRFPKLRGKFTLHSWGEEHPACREGTEGCYEANRRVEFLAE